tara:strand:- start:1933 stop:5916 length:3984 start_codon:yes stop_codon:yes gene_type:complete
MEYDPNERFREDPGEMELSPEFNAEMQLQEEAAQLEDTQLDETSTPTGEQPEQAPQAEISTESQEEEPFDKTKDFSFYEAQGMSRGEWNRRQMATGTGGELEGFAEDPRYAAELAAAVPTSLLDFGVDVLNVLPGVNIPKLTKFENETAQAVRQISSVVTPMLIGGSALKSAGTAANTRVGWSVGQNKFVQFMGDRGVEALTGLGVGLVSSEYEEDNATGTLKKAFPKTFDFIPDSMATLDSDTPDMKRQKNIREDIGLGFVTDLALGSVKFIDSIVGTTGALRKSNKLVGETPQSRKWLDTNKPPASSADPEEAVIQSAIKQEEALDEMGMYGYSMNPAMDQPIKGIHDMYDYTEIGIRTVDDFGVVGASVDAVRVAKNLDTVYGRLGNVISEPALKYSLTSGDNAQDVVLGLADQLNQAGRIGMEGNGWKVTFDEVIDEGENLAIQLFDPRMSKADVRKVLEPFITRTDDGKEILAEGGFAMAAKALRGFGSDLTSMDVARAQSILAGSLSGRISDLSEGARLMEGTAAVEVAQEKIIDMMQYVTQLSASAKYYKNRKMNLIQQVQNGFKNIEGYNEATVLGAGETAKRIFEDAQRFGNTMRQIAANQPRLMDQFLMAYELTDGSIDTITKMNNYIAGMTTDLGKAIINLNPEIQNKLVAGVWSNVYNSILSAFKTPIQALTGNFGGIVSQPISYFAGAALSGKGLKAMQRGWIAYSSVGETMRKALPYAGDVFLKASREPDSIRSVTRTDLLLQSERELDFLKQAARAQAADGDDGLQYIVNQIEMLNDLGKDPVLRFGPNAMTALDGFTGVFNASAEARFRAMDELVASGKPITKENVKPIADKYYKEMFGDNGLLKDEAVKYANSEMALNLDTPLAQGVGDLVNTVPGMRPFLMFPTTGMNMIDMMGKYGPWTPFQRDINELAYTKLDDLLGNEERIDQLLKARNIDIESMDTIAKQNKIADLKYMTRGRKAIGALAVTGTVGLIMNDRITGDGLYDKETQMSRVKNSDWQKRTVKGLDGKRYSYDWMGPVADWIALTVNVVDNFDMLGEAAVENFLSKIGFVFGAAVTDRTGLSTIKPLLDILSGNEGAMTRWSAGFINSLGPLASQRGEWSRILSEGLKEVENDFMSQLENRNRFAGELDSSNRQPYVYSPVTGEKPNGYSFLQRVWNAYSPIKIHAEQSPEEKFLQEMEFDINTNFRSKNGVKLLATERSELFRLMGERGFFKEAIQEIMRDAGDWKSIEKLRELRNQGYKSDEVSLKKWHDIHARLSEARRAAEDFAFADMDADMYAALELRQVQKELTEEANIVGETFDDSILNIRN